jgi:hypothetical protein
VPGLRGEWSVYCTCGRTRWLLSLSSILAARLAFAGSNHRQFLLSPRAKHRLMDRGQCKHLLAVRLAEVLDKFVDKSLGLNWVAGLSTRFATVIPT